jgi:iron-sulfur cluster insertion protein
MLYISLVAAPRTGTERLRNELLATEDLSPGPVFEPREANPVLAAPEPSPVIITANAVRRIHYLRQKESRPDAALRLRIIAGGCSGMQYRMDLAETPRATDVIIAAEDAKVFVDPKSMVYLRGSTVDYEEDLLGGQFKITNPNAKHACSCGLSFTI